MNTIWSFARFQTNLLLRNAVESKPRPLYRLPDTPSASGLICMLPRPIVRTAALDQTPAPPPPGAGQQRMFETRFALEFGGDTLNLALAASGCGKVKVKHRPRLLSHNGPCYIAFRYRRMAGGIQDRSGPWHSGSSADAGQDRLSALHATPVGQRNVGIRRSRTASGKGVRHFAPRRRTKLSRRRTVCQLRPHQL